MIELWEGTRVLYLCIINDKKCDALRIFDAFEGKPQDGGNEDILYVAADLAEYPEEWRNWRVGAEVPSLVYERGEIKYGARLVARYDNEWYETDNMCYAARLFVRTYRAITEGDAQTDCDECRLSGLLEE